MLTFEYSLDQQLEIYCDQEGLATLLRELGILKERGGHAHLMTPSWAGHELTEDKQGENTELIHHVLIRLKPDNWEDPPKSLSE
jgi:CYTH domain-containing protein